MNIKRFCLSLSKGRIKKLNHYLLQIFILRYTYFMHNRFKGERQIELLTATDEPVSHLGWKFDHLFPFHLCAGVVARSANQ